MASMSNEPVHTTIFSPIYSITNVTLQEAPLQSLQSLPKTQTIHVTNVGKPLHGTIMNQHLVSCQQKEVGHKGKSMKY